MRREIDKGGRKLPFLLAMALDIRSKINGFVEGLLDHSQYFIVGVVQSPAGRKISVYLDGDHGVDIDYCGKISRQVSRLIDEDPALENEEKFTFEISSPGVDRPLVNSRQLPKHIGRFVEFKSEGKVHTGKLLAVSGETFTIAEDLKKEGQKKPVQVENTYTFHENLELKITIKF